MGKLAALTFGALGFVGGHIIADESTLFEHPENISPPIERTQVAQDAYYGRLADERNNADRQVRILGAASGLVIYGLGRALLNAATEDPVAFSQGFMDGFKWMPGSGRRD